MCDHVGGSAVNTLDRRREACPSWCHSGVETPGEEGTDTGEQWEEATASDPAVSSCEERTALSIESAKDCGCVFRGFLLVIVNLE